MTITNHILAGSIIGLTVTNPIVAVVLALASHFVLDALPHFGYAGRKGYSEALNHKLSYIVAAVTLITSVGVVLFLAFNAKWWPILTGLIAASPDAFGVYNWLVYEKHNKPKPKWLTLSHDKFHRAIQWCERPWGLIIEVIVFLILSTLLLKLM